MEDQNMNLIESLTGLINRGETAEEALELAAEILLEIPPDVLRDLLLLRAQRSKAGAAPFMRRFAIAKEKSEETLDPEQVWLFEALGTQAATLVSVKISEALHHRRVSVAAGLR